MTSDACAGAAGEPRSALRDRRRVALRAQRAPHHPGGARIAEQAELRRRRVALVVAEHLYARVGGHPGEEASHERGVVAAPHRPLAEHERLVAVELGVIEAVE